MNINTKILLSLEKLRMDYVQRIRAFAVDAVLSECGFHLHQCQNLAYYVFFNRRFLWGMMANNDLNVYIIARGNLFRPCKIGRTPYGARPGIGRCYDIQADACAICDYAKKR